MSTVTGPATTEPIIDPDLPIVDAHHHLWFVPPAVVAEMPPDNPMWPIYRRRARYLFDELLADLTAGHNVRATVFVNAHAMYRASGPEAMKSVGEVEFVNGVAAMGASGIFGDIQVCAGIVGDADLRLGDAVEEILEAHIRAGGSRYRGVRNAYTAYDPHTEGIFRAFSGNPAGILNDAKYRAGLKKLHVFGLSYDILVLEPQLPEVIDLARAFPETQIILNHFGMPVGKASYAGQREERFPIWCDNMRTLATCDNVIVKLGGATVVTGFPSYDATPPAASVQLAAELKPYIETCIELFGANRCMFEGDFPVSSATASYPVLWNAFKRLAAGASKEEKTALFSGTATRVYRLDI